MVYRSEQDLWKNLKNYDTLPGFLFLTTLEELVMLVVMELVMEMVMKLTMQMVLVDGKGCLWSNSAWVPSG